MRLARGMKISHTRENEPAKTRWEAWELRNVSTVSSSSRYSLWYFLLPKGAVQPVIPQLHPLLYTPFSWYCVSLSFLSLISFLVDSLHSLLLSSYIHPVTSSHPDSGSSSSPFHCTFMLRQPLTLRSDYVTVSFHNTTPHHTTPNTTFNHPLFPVFSPLHDHYHTQVPLLPQHIMSA